MMMMMMKIDDDAQTAVAGGKEAAKAGICQKGNCNNKMKSLVF